MLLKYDLHTHILPGVDDGAKCIDEALELMRVLDSQGVENVVFTPHLYTHKESVEDFLERRELSYKEFKPHIPENMTVKLAAEVYVTDYLFAENHDFSKLCIEDTPYMITEFSYNSTFSESTMRKLGRLKDMGVVPIIPHIERYPSLMKHKSLVEKLSKRRILIQSNVSSFTDRKLARKLLKYLKAGYIQILSTDAHSLTRNSPENVTKAEDIILKKLSRTTLERLNLNANMIFDGDII